MQSEFRGPVFIIGKPRTGTKLLARILEQHPDTAIEVAETQFLPYLLTNPQLISGLNERARFEEFYRVITTSTAYFTKYHQALIPLDLWYDSCADYSISSVLEVLVKFYTNQLGNPKAVWGDKSNNYIVHVPLLKRHFPSAKFIHIVRDVRDASLSSQSAWNTNIYRYTQRWYDDVNTIRQDSRALSPSDYLEIRYEDLLGQAENVVRQCTDFLGLDFDERMLTFKKQSEAVGDARGMKTIKSDNVGKYEQRLSSEQLRRIERIAWPLLKDYGYPFEYTGKQQSVPRWQMRYWQALDVLNRMRFDFGKIGAAKSLRELITLRYLRSQYHHFRQIVMPRVSKK